MNVPGGVAVGGFLTVVLLYLLAVLWEQAIPCFYHYMWVIALLVPVFAVAITEELWRRIGPGRPPDQDDPPRGDWAARVVNPVVPGKLDP